MIGHCFNPECKQELHYLRQGSVYQWETSVGRYFHSEFFWLCPVCTSTFELASDKNGRPLLAPCGSRCEHHPTCSRIRRVLQGVAESSGRADVETSASSRTM
jgi:hypothetical protein